MFCQVVNLFTDQGSAEFRIPLYVIMATPLGYHIVKTLVVKSLANKYCRKCGGKTLAN